MSGKRSTRSRRKSTKMAVDEVAEAAEEEVEETIPEEANGEEMEEDESGNGDDNNNDQEISNDDGSESSSLGSISGDVAEEQEDMGTSPSPNKKKDMHLRSGKRKRRRSKETSGLTPPPDTVSARKRPRRGSPARESAKKGTVEDKNSDTVAVAETIAEETTQPAEEIAPPRKARDSILQSDKPALSAANQESEIPDPLEKDDGRRLFDAKPPAMPTATAATSESLLPAPVVQQQQQQQKQQQKQATQEQTEVVAPEELEEPPPSEFKIPPKAMMGPVVVFYILLIVLSGRIWIPLAGKLALSIIPLNEEALLPPVVMEEEVVVDADPDSPHQVPAVIWNGLAELEKAQVTIGSSSEDLSAYKADMAALIKMVRKHADVSKRKLMIRFGGLVEAEKILQTALKESDASPKVWKDAKDAMAALGLPNQKLLDTSLIDMWQVADPIECPEDPEIDGGAEVEVMENKDPPISPRIFESTETNLLLRATMTAEKIVRSAEAEVNIRNWVREKIDTAIEDEDEILAALEQIQAMSSDDDDTNTLSIEMVGALLQERLELEMADGTGEFDHAALMSGAKIIYGGKRGTTKSITDSLPLANRLMQLASLRFYGHGPEAAITPTYPKNSLGQCWSFQALPVKEQLKINQQDDHKHGSFGTLTISFAKPVQIENISIEHPTVTDHPKSAIRGFRIIGYGDALAEGSGQPMGSFQYRMGGASIQKFPVADKGPMQSVSLAIDSNWGLEYACLYRFRVHGVAVVED